MLHIVQGKDIKYEVIPTITQAPLKHAMLVTHLSIELFEVESTIKSTVIIRCIRLLMQSIGRLIHKGDLTSKTVTILPSLDPSLIFSLHLFPSPVKPYQILLLFLPWLPCHFYVVVLEQQLHSSPEITPITTRTASCIIDMDVFISCYRSTPERVIKVI